MVTAFAEHVVAEVVDKSNADYSCDRSKDAVITVDTTEVSDLAAGVLIIVEACVARASSEYKDENLAYATTVSNAFTAFASVVDAFAKKAKDLDGRFKKWQSQKT
ncbi:hypothetical protein AGMMS49593_03620 [Endomicrobiia bacterium]|nr:hypothetical protein AGMMS49593_03620 [Endomicrobiia bacterium]